MEVALLCLKLSPSGAGFKVLLSERQHITIGSAWVMIPTGTKKHQEAIRVI
jgi:hypothetical protein